MALQSALASMLRDATMLAFVLHIGGGTIGLVSGTMAAFARKGGRLHRSTGTVFFVSMLVMAAFAAYLAVVRPGQVVNLLIAILASYLVTTAWLTAHRKTGPVGVAEKIGFAVILSIFLPFALLSFELATGMTPFLKGSIPFKGPILIAVYVFTTMIGIAAITDAKVVFAGGISGAPRIARHLWRMCLGLAMAAGSAFTNGLPRLLPGPMHVTTIYFLPQLVPLALLVYWMMRVRLTGWIRQSYSPRAAAG
jgi:hypothetical protein